MCNTGLLALQLFQRLVDAFPAECVNLQAFGQYGIPKDIMFGFPVTCESGEYKLVEGLEIDAFSRERINKTLEELQGEQAGVAHLL